MKQYIIGIICNIYIGMLIPKLWLRILGLNPTKNKDIQIHEEIQGIMNERSYVDYIKINL